MNAEHAAMIRLQNEQARIARDTRALLHEVPTCDASTDDNMHNATQVGDDGGNYCDEHVGMGGSDDDVDATFTERIAWSLVQVQALGVSVESYRATIVDMAQESVVSITQEDPEGGCEVFVRVPGSYAVAYDMRFGIGTPVNIVANAVRAAFGFTV